MPGDLAVFSLKPTFPNADKLQIKWDVSLGTIEEGQGSAKISVRTDEKRFYALTTTATVTGLPVDCANTASATVGVAGNIDIFPIDEFAPVSRNDERGRIDVALAHVKEHPNFHLIFVLRAPKRASKASIATRKDRIERHVVGLRRFPRSRIHFVRQNSSDITTVIYKLSPESIADSFQSDTVLP